MKVVLVSPHIKIYGNPHYFIFPHTGIGYIAAALKASEYEVKIVDLNFDKITDLLEVIKSEEVLFVGFSIFSKDVFFYNRLAKMVKKINPNIPIIVGGPHANVFPERTLIDFDSIDFLIYGESERTIKKLYDVLKMALL